jgi:hypothetical protein
MYDLLIPREFTKLDEIVEIVFFTAGDIIEEEPGENDSDDKDTPKLKPVAFHQKCVDRIEKHLDVTLVKQTKTQYLSSDESIALICAISKEHDKGGKKGYWFAFHPHQKDILQKSEKGYVAFGCGSEELLFLIPAEDLIQWTDRFNTTQKNDRYYWHIYILYDGNQAMLICKAGYDSIDLKKYTL